METTSSATSGPTAYDETWLAGYDDTKFYTRTYTASAPRAVLLFLHGFAEHVGRYEWAHGVYASRGITVFTYDQRGFGRTALDKENKSKNSSYGRTSWHDQLSDIQWWIKHLKEQHPHAPLFLMGHSMGGGLTLAFVTRTSAPPEKESLSTLSGVIASSPLLLQTFPVSGIARYVGGKASGLLPNFSVSAPVPVEDLSHNQAANEAVLNDPWITQKGSLQGLHDMLSGGEKLLWNDHKYWPKNMPLLIIHGDADRVTSFKASQEFFDKVDTEDKEFKPFKGGFHELVHEPDGVKEKFVDVCIAWTLKRAEERKEPNVVVRASL